MLTRLRKTSISPPNPWDKNKKHVHQRIHVTAITLLRPHRTDLDIPVQSLPLRVERTVCQGCEHH